MVELHGINRKSGDGDVSIMEWNAQRLGLPLCLRPRIHYADANVKLPFSSDHFDVIFSQVTYLYIVEKLNFLKEIGRILTREGVAKLDIGEVDSPNPRKNWIEIWMGGNLLPFQSLIDRTPGWTFERRGLHGHLVVRKPIRATYGDELVTTLPLPRLNREWVGVRSIYRWEPHTMALDASAVIFELAPVHEAGLSYEACLPRIEGRYQGFVTEDWQMEGCRTSSRRNVQALGEGRWCMEDTRLGTSIFLSATSGTVDDHVYRLVVPVKPVHF
jgi:SAM-dependent methyltransferase